MPDVMIFGLTRRRAAVTARYPEPRHFIGGEWRGGAGNRRWPVVNPATGETLAMLPLATEAEIDAALAAAETGFAAWRPMTALERFAVLRRASDLMRARAAEIGEVLTLEQGKPLAESIREVTLSADIIDFLAEEGKRAYGRVVPSRSADILSQAVMKVPVGPVAALTPWNFPANLPSRKIGGALAAGCSCILKPAENTPGTAVKLVECFAEAGLPAGVLNLILGEPGPISARLIASPITRKVSFTGSIAVGKEIGKLAAAGMKRYTPELGGHAPVIILADADIEKVVALSVTAKYRNAGQICTSPTRFLVAKPAYGRFVEAFAAAAKAIKLGDGRQRETGMGPLAHERRLAAMERCVAGARKAGARIVAGGERLDRPGFFFAPTVMADVPLDAPVMQDEPFGPIAAIRPFNDAAEAVAIANALPYGLAAYLFTADLGRAHALSAALEAGMVGVNHFGVSQPETPFGGVKESGYGSESGAEGLLGYMDTKLISLARPPVSAGAR